MTYVAVTSAKPSLNFNSHAHVERDMTMPKFTTIMQISTHTLTWSVTPKKPLSNDGKIISTHTLTWSVTKIINAITHTPDISTHTLTWSVTCRGFTSFLRFCISTHTLTWSVTLPSSIRA